MIKELELFIFTFLVIYLSYIVFVLCRKKVLSKFPNSISAIYLKKRYNVTINDKNLKKVAHAVYLANSITVSIVCLFKSFILGLLAGIVPLILMILVFYHVLGMIFKGGKKNV